MLEVNTEFRKGVFFIRLIGELTKKTYFKISEVNNIIKDNGITTIVLNLYELNLIDKMGLNSIKLLGDIFICGINKKIRKDIENSDLKVFEIDNELSILV